jgi:hypothetical protein
MPIRLKPRRVRCSAVKLDCARDFPLSFNLRFVEREHPLPKLRLRLRTVDMFGTCRYAVAMPKMIQLRHVPDDLHRKLKARAALVGLPLSDYLIQEIRRVAERPTIAELRSRLAHRPSIRPTVPPAKAVRMERDGR